MSLPRKGRPRRGDALSKPIPVRFTDDELSIVEGAVPRRGLDRSAVIRRAVDDATRLWAFQELVDMDFEQLRQLCVARREFYWCANRDDQGRVQLERAQALATVTCTGPEDLDRLHEVVAVLDHDHILTGAVVAGPGAVLFTAFVAMQGRGGAESAREDAMYRLSKLPDDEPWKLEIARQIARPDRWQCTPSSHEEHEAWRRVRRVANAPHPIERTADREGVPMSDTEDRLWTLAQNLVDHETDFAWGGGGIDGPSLGQRDEGFADDHRDFEKVGFDAGSLAQYMIFQAFGVKLPRTTFNQRDVGAAKVSPEPGDLLFDGADYNTVYLGRGHVVEAGRSGDKIRIAPTPRAVSEIRRVITR